MAAAEVSRGASGIAGSSKSQKQNAVGGNVVQVPVSDLGCRRGEFPARQVGGLGESEHRPGLPARPGAVAEGAFDRGLPGKLAVPVVGGRLRHRAVGAHAERSKPARVRECDTAQPVLARPGGGSGQQRHSAGHAVDTGAWPGPAVQIGVLLSGRQQRGDRVEVRGQGPRSCDGQLGLGVPGGVQDRGDPGAVPEQEAAQHRRRAGPAAQSLCAVGGQAGEAALPGGGRGEPEYPGPEPAGPAAVLRPRPFAGLRIGEHREPPRRDLPGLLDAPQQAR